MKRDTLIPGVRKSLWSYISRQLKAPDIRHTRKMGLLHESPIPNVTQSIPVIHVTRREDNAFLYFFGATLRKKRLSPCFEHICGTCFGQDIRIRMSEGAAICGSCGSFQYTTQEEPSLRQQYGPATSTRANPPRRPRKHTPCYYKRRNHFKYWLHRIQGRETNPVKRTHIEAVKTDLERHFEETNYETIRTSLKRLNLKRFYNNIYYIQKQLIGYALLDLTRKQEEKLMQMFIEIQGPFANHAMSRVNMLYYSYLIKKFAEILKWDEVAEAMPSLKSTSKNRYLDSIWKQICDETGYPFIRSV